MKRAEYIKKLKELYKIAVKHQDVAMALELLERLRQAE